LSFRHGKGNNRFGVMQKATQPDSPTVADKWIQKFLAHLATDRGASVYTQRNYKQALTEFCLWNQNERNSSPVWDQLQRDDFRSYLRFLGRQNLGRAAIALRFSALRTFYLCRNRADGCRSFLPKNK